MPADKPFPFKIGADPEFTFTSQGKPISASVLMSEVIFKDIESHNGGFDIDAAGNIGWDGCNSTGEIRPNPANTPQQVVDNLRTLIKAIYDRIKIVDMITDSKFASIGGHVHLEMDRFDNKILPLNDDKTLIKNALCDRKIRIMHNKVASFYLPLLLGENVINLKLRHTNSYGKISDYRCERKGRDTSTPSYTYEFRAPSAEWLTTPRIAKATLAYIATVYNEIVNHPNKHKWSKIAINNIAQGDALQTLAMGGHDLFEEYFTNKIKKIIPDFEYYKDYKDDINFILNSQKVKAEKEKVNFSIIEGWFGKQHQPSIKTLVNQKQLAKSDLNNLEEMMRLITIPYNDDLNVATFVTEIKKRIIAYGWKLNKQYFFFGIRQGIEKPLVINGNGAYLAGKEQIKTFGDKNAINEVANKMFKNMKNSLNLGDYIFSKLTEKEKNQYVIFGIPYKWRTENNYKTFIKNIIDLEKKEIDGDRLSDSELIDDYNESPDQMGEIARLYRKKELDNNRLAIPRDQSETYQNIAREVNEQRLDETSENTDNLDESNNDDEVDEDFDTDEDSDQDTNY